MIIEQAAPVPGATLRYRLSGKTDPAPVLVFENGWGASYEMWAWIERELAPHARLLFYNRAGIGGSSITGSQTAERLSLQLRALLQVLKIDQPVILVGQSYGGLMCSLHATQQPAMIAGLLELDPSPHLSDPALDPRLRMMIPIARCMILLARLGIPDPLFGAVRKTLPHPEGDELIRKSFRSADSLRAGIAELQLLDAIREAIAAGTIVQPQLVVSADATSAGNSGVLGRLLAPPEKLRPMIEGMQASHRAKVGRNPKARWSTLPHDHGGVVFDQAGAKDSARCILDFLATLSPTAT